MLPQKLVGRVINAKITGYTLSLDVGIVSVKINSRVFKVFYSNSVSAEASAASAEFVLKLSEVFFVENESFKLVPSALKVNLDPAVEYIVGRIPVYESGHSTLLKPFVNSEAVYAAGDTAPSEQRHKKCAFCVALAVAVTQNFRCTHAVINVISEKYAVSDKVIDSLYPFKFPKGLPFFLSDKLLYANA